MQVPEIIDPYAYLPRGFDLVAAARYLGPDLDALRSLVEASKLPSTRRLGGASVWDRMALYTAFEAAPADEEPGPKSAWKRTGVTCP